MTRLLPRLPSATALDRTSDAALPADVLEEQLRRLTVFALVSGGLWAIGLLMDAVVLPLMNDGREVARAGLLIQLGAIVLAVAVYAWARFSPLAPQAKSDAGLWLMLVNAGAIALIETWANEPTHLMLGQLSWTSIAILLSAMIVPSTPLKMLTASLAAASLGPVGVWLAHLRGIDVPSALGTMLMYAPTYSCALAAVVPARMFQRMGRSLQEARDLGSYELEARLGAGGMGEVWRARHRLLARPAAIKLVKPEMLGAGTASDSRLVRRRFESEAQATAALTSPNTVRLFDFGVTDEGRFYYVMELLNGRDMAALVSEFGALPAPRVLFLLRQVCHSLAEAHSRGLVHRDIKPANIFVCCMGLDADVVKVLDFGLVQFIQRDPTLDLTQSLIALEGVVGTPAFMAPEVILGRQELDHRADIYALGCVAYFLLTGEHVFQGDAQMQVLFDHVSTVPQPPSSRTALEIPAWLDRLVLDCLEKDPARRPDDAADLLRRIGEHGTGPQWTNAAARAWWQLHLPELMEGVTLERPAVQG